MSEASLQITYRHGKALAAYWRLPGDRGRQSVNCRQFEPDLVVDYSANEQPIGIEILSPGHVTLEQFNAVLVELGEPPVSADEFAPLLAA